MVCANNPHNSKHVWFVVDDTTKRCAFCSKTKKVRKVDNVKVKDGLL